METLSFYNSSINLKLVQSKNLQRKCPGNKANWSKYWKKRKEEGFSLEGEETTSASPWGLLSTELTAAGNRENSKPDCGRPPGLEMQTFRHQKFLFVPRPSTCTRPGLCFPTHDSTTSSLRKPEKQEEHRAGYKALLTTADKFRLRSGANTTPKELTAVATMRARPYLRHLGVQHNTSQHSIKFHEWICVCGGGRVVINSPLTSPLDLTNTTFKWTLKRASE